MTDLPMAQQVEDSRRYVPRRRSALNAPGPFYAEANACMTCCLPEWEAPDLMGLESDDTSPNFGCFFKEQPETPEELDRALSAMQVNCISTLRYAGRDPAILRRLRELGIERQCDFPLAGAEG